MNRLFKSMLMAGVSAVMLTGTVDLMAQQGGGGGGGGGRGGRGNFDPAQFQQRMLDQMKETLAVTDEAEWKVISERLGKVQTLRMEAMRGGFGGRGRGGPGGTANPEVDELQKAIDANNAADIKTSLAKLRESRAKKQADLKEAQAKLKEVLSAKQEAQLVLRGTLE